MGMAWKVQWRVNLVPKKQKNSSQHSRIKKNTLLLTIETPQHKTRTMRVFVSSFLPTQHQQ